VTRGGKRAILLGAYSFATTSNIIFCLLAWSGGSCYTLPVSFVEKMMQRKPKIAIVGRPNVGKSALFNRICGKKISIVDEAEGVTRDRIYGEAELFGTTIQVIDTGGIGPASLGPYQEQISAQAELAGREADVVIMVVDGVVGVTTFDEQVARHIQKLGKPVCVAVNKVDNLARMAGIELFRSLGFEKIIAVSALQGFQIAELLEEALALCPDIEEEAEPISSSIRVAIVGRANVGKSTLMNGILGEERCLVSPIAGTTRDSIDENFECDGVAYTLVDTAGIRRKRAENEAVDKFAAIRTEKAIESSDVCLLVVEATGGITTQEKRIARHIYEQGKGCIILLNKWDLVQGYRMEHCIQALRISIPFLSYAPIECISAATGRKLEKIFPLVKTVYEEGRKRISTGQLNRLMQKAIQKYHPPMLQGGRRLRLYYLTQVAATPPQFVLFVNDPELMVESYRKYLIAELRREYQFVGVPIIFSMRAREDKRTRIERRADPLPELGGSNVNEELFAIDEDDDEESFVLENGVLDDEESLLEADALT